MLLGVTAGVLIGLYRSGSDEVAVANVAFAASGEEDIRLLPPDEALDAAVERLGHDVLVPRKLPDERLHLWSVDARTGPPGRDLGIRQAGLFYAVASRPDTPGPDAEFGPLHVSVTEHLVNTLSPPEFLLQNEFPLDRGTLYFYIAPDDAPQRVPDRYALIQEDGPDIEVTVVGDEKPSFEKIVEMIESFEER